VPCLGTARLSVPYGPGLAYIKLAGQGPSALAVAPFCRQELRQVIHYWTRRLVFPVGFAFVLGLSAVDHGRARLRYFDLGRHRALLATLAGLAALALKESMSIPLVYRSDGDATAEIMAYEPPSSLTRCASSNGRLALGRDERMTLVPGLALIQSRKGWGAAIIATTRVRGQAPSAP
jgi:hypothetical protein